MSREYIWNADPRYEPENDQDERDSAETDAEMLNDDRRMNKTEDVFICPYCGYEFETEEDYIEAQDCGCPSCKVLIPIKE